MKSRTGSVWLYPEFLKTIGADALNPSAIGHGDIVESFQATIEGHMVESTEGFVARNVIYPLCLAPTAKFTDE